MRWQLFYSNFLQTVLSLSSGPHLFDLSVSYQASRWPDAKCHACSRVRATKVGFTLADITDRQLNSSPTRPQPITFFDVLISNGHFRWRMPLRSSIISRTFFRGSAQRPGNSVRQIIVPSWRMRDRVLPARRRPTLERDELGDHSVIVEQIDHPGLLIWGSRSTNSSLFDLSEGS